MLSLNHFQKRIFKLDLIKNKYLITNAGFQLPAEAIFIGKQILCKPLNGQPEQEHNGEILKNLGYATLCNNFCLNTIESWLKSNSFVQKKFNSLNSNNPSLKLKIKFVVICLIFFL